MNYIVISPYYPQNFQQFTVELANKGITVLGIGQEPYDQLNQSLKNALTEYFRVENLENLDEVKRAVAFLFYKHGLIDRIESHNEYWLDQDAKLREQFNVVGPKPKDLKKTKFKSEMKKLFKKAGVPVVPGQIVKTLQAVDMAVSKIGLPMIAQPELINWKPLKMLNNLNKSGISKPFISLKNSLTLDKFARLTDYSIQKEILCFQRLLTMLIPL